MEPIRLKLEKPNSGSLAAAETAIRMVAGVLSVHVEPKGDALHVEAADGVTPDDLVAAARKAGHILSLVG